jgi:hypothetical protein
MAAHLIRSDCEGYNAVNGTDDMLWNDSKEDRDVRSECVEGEGTDCEVTDSNSLVKVERNLHALCIKCMKLIVKYFFSRRLICKGSS